MFKRVFIVLGLMASTPLSLLEAACSDPMPPAHLLQCRPIALAPEGAMSTPTDLRYSEMQGGENAVVVKVVCRCEVPKGCSEMRAGYSDFTLPSIDPQLTCSRGALLCESICRRRLP